MFTYQDSRLRPADPVCELVRLWSFLPLSNPQLYFLIVLLMSFSFNLTFQSMNLSLLWLVYWIIHLDQLIVWIFLCWVIWMNFTLIMPVNLFIQLSTKSKLNQKMEASSWPNREHHNTSKYLENRYWIVQSELQTECSTKNGAQIIFI